MGPAKYYSGYYHYYYYYTSYYGADDRSIRAKGKRTATLAKSARPPENDEA